MSRSAVLARYRHLRQISKEQHDAVLDITAADVLLDWARRLDLTEGKAVVLENDNEMTMPEDLAIYLPRLGRSHPLHRYARVARLAPGSDEAIVLAAMRQARFSLWRVERRHPTTGLILRDLLRDGEAWLVDEAMGKNAPPGVEMAARLLQPESFAMTARVIVPILPDLMTVPDLMEDVFARVPGLRRLQGDALARDPRFAIGIYRAAVATGTMERVRFKHEQSWFHACGSMTPANRNYPPLWCSDHAVTVCRMVLKTLVPGLRRAVSTTVRMSASPSAAHIAR